jgi:hypothetical protein
MKGEADENVDMGLSQLRTAAIERTDALLRQLAEDQADLAHWTQRPTPRWMEQAKAVEIALGPDVVSKVTEAAQRVRDRLQGG